MEEEERKPALEKDGNVRGWLAWPIDQHWWFLRYPYVIVVRSRSMPWHREASLGLVSIHDMLVGNFV